MDILKFIAQPTSDEVLRQRLLGLVRLLDVTRTIATEIDLDELLKSLAREACHAIFCERATVYQYDSSNDELFTRVATELEISEIRKSLSSGITGYAARNRQMINVPNPASDSRWDPSIDRQTGFQTRNILAAPLISPHDGSLLGALQLLNNESGPFDEFDELLMEAFCQHASAALDRARFVGRLREQEALNASLEAARNVQRTFMPDTLPPIEGYEAATWWFPNQAVGGDYCDVLPLPDGRMGLVIADVSGHGLGPSLIMASVRAALRALVLEHTLPELLLNMLGRALEQDLQDDLFITMVMACLDPVAHTLEFANAGHAPAYHYSLSQNVFHPLEATGLPLGVLDRPEYPQGPPAQLEVGDLVVLCTDGIVESTDSLDRPFGQSRLLEIIRRYREAPTAELVTAIGEAVSHHYQGDTPPDDLTVLAVRRNGH